MTAPLPPYPATDQVEELPPPPLPPDPVPV